MTVTCFLLEHTNLAEAGLRRYTDASPACPLMPGKYSYHQATVILGRTELTGYATRGDIPPERSRHYFELPDGRFGVPDFIYPPPSDPRWPTRCGCGYEFTPCTCGHIPCQEQPPAAAYQEWAEALYRRAGTGELMTIRAAPEGAMWDAYWYPWKGPDGRSLAVKCPGGSEWVIDSRASNCTLPKDTEHRCWVRHGEPPRITVDKNGRTCQAGAGSIQTPNYHGFLRDGKFTP